MYFVHAVFQNYLLTESAEQNKKLRRPLVMVIKHSKPIEEHMQEVMILDRSMLEIN